eukprot:4793672-Pleurochrysis_carterae.AAC.2
MLPLAAPVFQVNQHHIRDTARTVLLDIYYKGGMLSVTPDHAIYIDGTYAPAQSARPGAYLSDGLRGSVQVKALVSPAAICALCISFLQVYADDWLSTVT